MRSVMLQKAVLVSAVAVALLAPPAAQAGWIPDYCHAGGITECLGNVSLNNSTADFRMNGTPSLALVEQFESPSKPRSVYWSKLEMSGKTTEGGQISATLNPKAQSSGTVLSVESSEFPATATMRFFLRIESGGLTLVSSEPAVFQGVIHAIPPAPGDKLSLISGPVKFHEEGGSTSVVLGTLNSSNVAFGRSSASLLPPAAEWALFGFAALVLASGGLYVRRRTLATA